ncbi:MAG: hypothetical protein GY757_14175, partial [bacterium]|nr:hypothetical protein [bacterium]
SRNAEGKIMIPLARSQTKGEVLQSFDIDIIYFSKGETMGAWGRHPLRFPTSDIMVTKMLWSVYLPQDYTYLHFKGNVEKEKIAGTVNLLLGNKRNFSFDQADYYNEVASNLEKAPKQQQIIVKNQQYTPSSFKNRAIGQKEIASQMRQEANLNIDFQREQGKQLGKPGSGSNIFKIELPTNGQIYRFNKTIIEGEPIKLFFYYTTTTLVIIIKIIVLLVVILILFLFRRKIYALIKGIYHWLSGLGKVREYLGTKKGLRTTLFAAAVIFFPVSHVLFVVLVLLFLISVFRPHWLLSPRGITEDKKG